MKVTESYLLRLVTVFFFFFFLLINFTNLTYSVLPVGYIWKKMRWGHIEMNKMSLCNGG